MVNWWKSLSVTKRYILSFGGGMGLIGLWGLINQFTELPIWSFLVVATLGAVGAAYAYSLRIQNT